MLTWLAVSGQSFLGRRFNCEIVYPLTVRGRLLDPTVNEGVDFGAKRSNAALQIDQPVACMSGSDEA
jgi:hypothetical protein